MHAAAPSPSTIQASPLSTPHPQQFPNGSQNRVKANDAPKQRARLACASCRLSKVRCSGLPENASFKEACANCTKKGQECLWSDPGGKKASASGLDSPSTNRAPEPRKRRKTAPVESMQSFSMSTEAIYEPKLYNKDVWKELYNIFQQHYATEFPFIHETSFLPKLEGLDIQSLPDGLAPLTLAFLALTVPFHAGILRQLREKGISSPIHVSRDYAAAAEYRIREAHNLAKPSPDLAQALLMLSLRAHGDCQGNKSFKLLGDAIDCMYLLGCHWEVDLDERAKRMQQMHEGGDEHHHREKQGTKEERFIEEEIKRRTFWSCFIIDSYIGTGNLKPRRIFIEGTLVQLPCKDEAFQFGDRTKTRMLRETDEDFNKRRQNYVPEKNETRVEWEDEDTQEPLVWLIKALDLYGDVFKWAVTITRRNETNYPWQKAFIKTRSGHHEEERLSFANLDERLKTMIEKLPAKLQLTQRARDTKIGRPTLTPYVLLHSVLCYCNIALHREWLPYLPAPADIPGGPTEGPDQTWLDELKQHPNAPAFFKDSASRCFKAGKDYLDLMWTCKQRGVLVETPFTAFVMDAVTYTIMWCAFHYNMDQDHHLCDGQDSTLVYDNFDKAVDLLYSLQNQLTLARDFCRRITDVHFLHMMEARKIWKALNNSPPGSKEMPKYPDIESDHKGFGGREMSDSEDASAFKAIEPPDLRCLLRARQQKMNREARKNSPSAIKVEVKSESGSNMEGSYASSSVPPTQSTQPTHTSFTTVNAPKPKPADLPSHHIPSPQLGYQTTAKPIYSTVSYSQEYPNQSYQPTMNPYSQEGNGERGPYDGFNPSEYNPVMREFCSSEAINAEYTTRVAPMTHLGHYGALYDSTKMFTSGNDYMNSPPEGQSFYAQQTFYDQPTQTPAYYGNQAS